MGYSVLSKYRSELMGAAMLWVMLFHAADLTFPIPGLDLFRAAGFGGVDIFILLSAMGLSLSLSRLEQEYGAFLARRARRILPAYFVVMVPYTLFLILRGQAPLSALVWNSTLLASGSMPLGPSTGMCPASCSSMSSPPGVSAGCAAPGTGCCGRQGPAPRRWLCATC